MEIKKKENEYNKKENEYNKNLDEIKVGTVIALKSEDGKNDNYYIVSSYNIWEYPFVYIDEEPVFEDILVTNFITGNSTFLPPYFKCKIINLEVKEL